MSVDTLLKKMPSREYLNECFILTEDGNLIWKKRPINHFKTKHRHSGFNKTYAGSLAGCDMGNGYKSVSVDGKRYKIHRVIFHMVIGDADQHTHIDHINGNTLDNRIENLRASNASDNAINFKGHRADSLSKCRGVTWKKKNKKWEAWAFHLGKRIYLGLYSDLSEAEKVAYSKRLELFGECWSSQNAY